MADPVTCRVYGERFTFSPETRPHEKRADEAGGKAVEREVRCPRCGSRRWVKFTGKLVLPPP